MKRKISLDLVKSFLDFIELSNWKFPFFCRESILMRLKLIECNKIVIIIDKRDLSFTKLSAKAFFKSNSNKILRIQISIRKKIIWLFTIPLLLQFLCVSEMENILGDIWTLLKAKNRFIVKCSGGRIFSTKIPIGKEGGERKREWMEISADFIENLSRITEMWRRKLIRKSLIDFHLNIQIWIIFANEWKQSNWRAQFGM